MRCLLVIMCSCFLCAPGCEQSAFELGEKAATPASEDAGIDYAPMEQRAGTDGQGESKAWLPDSNALQRKLIYTAEIDLIVEDFTPVPSQVVALAKRFDGYVASSQLTGSPGSPRSGHWTIRVPVQRYDEFLPAAHELGEVRHSSSQSRDVSEEYYDLEARIRNKKQAETRLLKHLEDSTGKLEEILKVENELDRVREKIEQMEGRMRVLNDLTSLTKVTLTVDEIKNYVPEEAATYGTRVRRSFGASLDKLVSAGKETSIGMVVAVPWLVVLSVPTAVLWFLVRIGRKRQPPSPRGGA